MNKLRARFDNSVPVKLADEAFEVKAPYLDGICIFRKGRVIAGYANLPDPQTATNQAAKLMERLP